MTNARPAGSHPGEAREGGVALRVSFPRFTIPRMSIYRVAIVVAAVCIIVLGAACGNTGACCENCSPPPPGCNPTLDASVGH